MNPMTTPTGGPAVGSERPRLYSIGHSNIALEDFLRLLKGHHIDVVADVRSSPRSRYVPHFDARPLQEALSQQEVKYVSLGRELGGRPDGDEFYDELGHVRYDKLAGSQTFQAGIDRVLRGARNYRIALLCSEEDPLKCHRHLLIGRVLRDRGVAVLHIRGDGHLQAEDDLYTAPADTSPQGELFTANLEDRRWRSAQSVSRRRAPLNSSGH
jgi:uncharacterized protein (DUF488 family)